MHILLSFIDHSFEEQKNFKRETAGIIINIKLILEFFANQNPSRDGFSNQHMDSIIALVLQVKFCFMSCLVKIGKQWLPNIKRGGELPKEEHFFAHSILMKAASKSI